MRTPPTEAETRQAVANQIAAAERASETTHPEKLSELEQYRKLGSDCVRFAVTQYMHFSIMMTGEKFKEILKVEEEQGRVWDNNREKLLSLLTDMEDNKNPENEKLGRDLVQYAVNHHMLINQLITSEKFADALNLDHLPEGEVRVSET